MESTNGEPVTLTFITYDLQSYHNSDWIEISNGSTSAGVMPPLHGLHSAQTNGILLCSECKLGGCKGLERCWLKTNEASNLFSRG